MTDQPNEQVLLMRKAKAQLSGNWGNAALITLVYGAISAIASFTYIGTIVIYGPLTFGYLLCLACLADRKEAKFDLLFKGFNRFVDTFVAGLLYTLAVSVGLCLLIVPGIIVACGFAMTFFIMVDDPTVSGVDALKQSWNMMNGHKWEYFCLMLRFIGWILLSCITCGILSFWVNPYMYVTTLNYYRRMKYGTY